MKKAIAAAMLAAAMLVTTVPAYASSADDNVLHVYTDRVYSYLYRLRFRNSLSR